eukprot:3181847-Pyramimonas_sp.AAC.1
MASRAAQERVPPTVRFGSARFSCENAKPPRCSCALSNAMQLQRARVQLETATQVSIPARGA